MPCKGLRRHFIEMFVEIYFLLMTFVLGLILGSFANVCILRIPKEASIITPGSHCPLCMKSLRWYHNIPLLSYIFLGGKCAYCRSPISIRYPLVELVTGLLTLSWFISFGFTSLSFILVPFGLLIIIMSGIDFEHYILPQELTYTLMAAGLLSSFFNPYMENLFSDKLIGRFFYSSVCLASGGGIIFIIRLLGTLAFKKEAMGIGDIKLMMGIGAYAGLKGIFWTIFIGSLLGSIAGLFMIIKGRKEKLGYIPFGPFLSGGAVIYMHLGRILDRFISL
ncbi:MAG: prepilin peptidase [Elusimicrobiota bacterium]